MRLNLIILSILTTMLLCQITTNGNITMDPKNKTDKEWKESLSSESYNVLRKKGTEPPGIVKNILRIKIVVIVWVAGILCLIQIPSMIQDQVGPVFGSLLTHLL